MTSSLRAMIGILCIVAATPAAGQTAAAGPADGPWLRDRGPGLPTSMFGTYIRKGEWLIYPFYEHYRDRDFEYKPEDLGVAGDVDYRGRYRAQEGILFVGFGITDSLAFEVEMATIRAELNKSPLDTSAVPSRLVESGLGDIEGQLRWRWRKETASRPELFSYAEIVAPHHRHKPLIGTADVEFKFGTGVVRGFSWGTVTARAAVEYAAGSSSQFDVGEYAVEYLRRLSPRWRLYLGVEGTQDEVSVIPELQWHLGSNVFVRLNSGVGMTSKATDWAPEFGVVFSLYDRR